VGVADADPSGVGVRGVTLWVVHHRELDLRSLLEGFERVARVAEGEEHVVLDAVA